MAAARHGRPRAHERDSRKGREDRERRRRVGGYRIMLATASIAVIIVIASVLSYELIWNTTSFAAFKQNFNSASNVAIYINDTYSNASAYLLGCGTAIVEQLTGPTAAHRNASTIHFFVINATGCVYNPGILGQQITNYTYTSASECLNYSEVMPSIFLSYGSNMTSIGQSRLSIRGDSSLMNKCGIAYQIV